MGTFYFGWAYFFLGDKNPLSKRNIFVNLLCPKSESNFLSFFHQFIFLSFIDSFLSFLTSSEICLHVFSLIYFIPQLFNWDAFFFSEPRMLVKVWAITVLVLIIFKIISMLIKIVRQVFILCTTEFPLPKRCCRRINQFYKRCSFYLLWARVSCVLKITFCWISRWRCWQHGCLTDFYRVRVCWSTSSLSLFR